MGRLVAIVQKEMLHIRRDSRTLGIMFLMPVIQMILLGYVATTNVEHLRTAVLDRDCTFQSRELIDVYRASNYFDIAYYVADETTLLQLLDSGKVRAGMIIPAGYEEQLLSHRQPQIAFLIDGSDPNVSNVALAAAQTVGQAQAVKVVQRQLGIAAGPMSSLEVRHACCTTRR
ncbi:MAG: ABC transporter permease [Anaerolineae bacterium]|jgi:ABC-2 type transport system permease protein|nr:ABC transporter permease [Anaerolineae bacterium]MDH7475555.1 ABC transporter permease [Anaerolineae bacterium]